MAAQGDVADEGAVLVSVTGADADENAAAKAAVKESTAAAEKTAAELEATNAKMQP